jgi:protein SCO1/2
MNQPKKKTNAKWFWSLAIILSAVVVYFIISNKRTDNDLPVIGEKGHTTGSFSFTNQDGKIITDDDVKGKIRVVEYFFTTCPAICPKMNTNLKAVYAAFKDQPDVIILSHTVNPQNDSAPILKAYATRYGVTDSRWQFLTGDKTALYKAASTDYLMAADTTGSIEDQFIHTQYVALVDKQNQIRGFYDATDSEKIAKLISDIKKINR